MNKDSYVAEPLSIIAENGLKLNELKDENVRKIGGDILNSWVSLLMYSKPYSGNFKHQGKEHKNVKFYNEREWRYIATKKEKSAPHGTLSKEKMENAKELEKANDKLKNYRLRFKAEDIKYIFVKEENEIHRMVSELRKIKSPIYNNKTVDILTSKILTTKQIIEDF